MKLNRKSPYAETVYSYVASRPGCSKADVARHVTRKRSFTKSYHIVNTAIRCGNIIKGESPNNRQYALYVNPEVSL